MSHDRRYLYAACEGSADGINPDTGKEYRDPTNVAPTRNGVVLCPGCRSGIGSCDNESNGPPFTRNGLLAVIDVDEAKRGMGQASIITIIAAGCSPVRAVETANGQYVWVAARGRNTQLRLPPDARCTWLSSVRFQSLGVGIGFPEQRVRWIWGYPWHSSCRPGVI